MKPSNSWWSLAEHPCRDRPPHVVFFFALPLQLDSDLRKQAMAKGFDFCGDDRSAIEKYITPWDVHWLVAASCGPEFTSTLHLERKYQRSCRGFMRFHGLALPEPCSSTRDTWMKEKQLTLLKCPKCGFVMLIVTWTQVVPVLPGMEHKVVLSFSAAKGHLCDWRPAMR